MKYERYLVHSIPLGYQRLYYAPFDVVGALPLEGGADLRSAPPAFKSLFLASGGISSAKLDRRSLIGLPFVEASCPPQGASWRRARRRSPDGRGGRPLRPQ